MADMEVGKVSLGVEIEGQSIREQAPEFEKAAEEVGKKGGESLNKGMRDKVKEGSKGLSNEFAKSGSNAGGSFLSKLKSVFGSGGKALIKMGAELAAGMAAAFAAKKIFNFAKEAIAAGSDLEEVQNVVDVTFGKMNKTVDEFAQNAATTIGMSEKVAKQYMGTFGAMGKAFGFGQQEVYDMSKALTELTGDVASFYNLDQQEAFDKLKAVFTGETEGLKSLGVVMTQNALDSFAMANGFGKVTAQMSEAEKVSLRYQFVLAKLNDASGDFSRTSTGWANQTRMLTLQFESLKAAIGQGLIAALGPAIQALNRFMGVLVKAANAFKNFMQALFGTSAGAAEMGGAVTGALSDITDTSADAINGITGVGSAASGAAKRAKKAAQDLRRTLEGFDQITKIQDDTSAAGASAGAGGTGGAGTAAAGIDAEAFQSEAGAVSAAASSLADKIRGFAEKIKEHLDGIKEYWSGWFDRHIRPTIESMKETWTVCVQNVRDGYDKYLKPTLDRLKEVWGDVITGHVVPAVEKFGDIVNKYWEKVFKPVISSLSELLMPVLSVLVDMIGTSLAGSVTVCADLFNGFLTVVDSIIESMGWLIEKIQTALDWFKKLPAVRDFFDGLGEAFSDSGTGKGIFDGLEKSLNAFKGNEILDGLSNLLSPSNTEITKTINLKKGAWTEDAFKASQLEEGSVARTLSQTVAKSSWSGDAWSAAQKGKATVKRKLEQTVKKGSWSSEAYTASKNKGGTVTRVLKVTASVANNVNNAAKKVLRAAGFNVAKGGIIKNGRVNYFASGGSITGNGRPSWWNGINKYAEGTSQAHGTMFLAGENGAEIVGNVNGATEVLNKSQIAASVASGVARVISRAGSFDSSVLVPHLAVIESHAARQTASLEAMAARVASASEGGNIREAISLLRDILVVLNIISNQPIYLDGQDIRKRIVNLINAHTQATGRCEIVV